MKVLGNYAQYGSYYPGKLFDVKGDKCTIYYDDGDREVDVSTSRLLFMPTKPPKKLRPEEDVLVSDGKCYKVGIVKRQQKNSVTVEMRNSTEKLVETTVKKKNVTVGELG